MVLLGPFWLLLGRFGPKMAPKMDPQMAPNRPQNHLKEGRCKLKTIKNVKLSLNLGLGFKMVPRWLKMAQVAQDNPKLAQKNPKIAPRWGKFGQDGPRLLQSCSSKAPTSPKIARICPKMAKMGQQNSSKNLLEPFSSLRQR